MERNSALQKEKPTMKKFLVVCAVLAILAAGGFAQTTKGYAGIGYSLDRYESAGNYITYSSVQLNLATYAGDTFGLYYSASLGVPVGFTLSSGTASVDHFQDLVSLYDKIRMSSTAVAVLAFNADVGMVNLLAGAGAGYSMQFDYSTDTTRDPMLFLWAGPALHAQVGVKLGANAGVFLSATCMIGQIDILGANSGLVADSQFCVMPAVGYFCNL